MQYHSLGRTGLKVSALCLGTMQFGWTADETTSFQVLDAAFEAGINFIDTADIYSRWVEGNPGGVAEQIIGKWIQKRGIARRDVILATKVRGRMGSRPNDEGLSRLHILNAIEDSLRRLQTDYIDLYQTHWPDDDTPLEETLSALDLLVRQGKVRYLGCSNYPAWKVVHSLWVAERLNLACFDSLQPHYNLVWREEFERELREVCSTFGLGIIPYSPLAGGFLSGKYRRSSIPASRRQENVKKYFTERNWALLEQVDGVAAGHGGVSTSQVALAWLLADPLITSPIIGPRNLAQLKDNLGSLDLFLTVDEIEKLNQVSNWRSC